MIENLFSILPTLPLFLGGLCVLLSQFIDNKKTKNFYIYRLPLILTLGFLILSIYLLFWVYSQNSYLGSFFQGQIKLDNVNFLLNLIYFIAAIVSLICSIESFKDKKFPTYEYLTLFLFSVAGMFYMTTAADWIVIFIGIELLSIPLYIMIGIAEKNQYSLEASLKYFLLGCFASGFMLMGIALMFGGTNSTNLSSLIHLSDLGYSNFYLKVGLVFFLLGIFFKIGLFPFHSWKPDVYQGANTFLTAFMSTAPKVAAIAVLFMICSNIPKDALNDFWSYLIVFISILSMFYGNILALRQNILKRLLAYSSIAQAGYICAAIGLGVREEVFYYIIAYCITSLSCFLIIAYLESYGHLVTFDSIGSLIRTKPFTTITFATFCLSFAGIPPFLGFWAKITLLFGISVFKTDLSYIVIFCIALNSAISIFYYLKVSVASIILTERGEITKMIDFKKFNYIFIICVSFLFTSVVLGWLVFQSSSLYYIFNLK